MANIYVDSAATGAANGTSEADAYTTINAALDASPAAGDIIYVKASGTYTETLTLHTKGSAWTNLIRMRGYTSTPGDGGMVTVDGGTNAMNTDQINTNLYWGFDNIAFTNSTSSAVDLADDQYAIFRNCKFDNGGSRGIYFDHSFTFINCQFSNNTYEGAQSSSTGYYFGCHFYGNGNDGVLGSGIVYKCLFNANGNGDDGTSGVATVLGCTFDGENNMNQGIIGGSYVFDNIIHDFTTGAAIAVAGGYNLYNSNTTNSTGGHQKDYQNVVDAPAFADEAGNDYSLSETSPAIDAGITPGTIS